MSFAVFTRQSIDAWPDADAEALVQFAPGTFHVRQSTMGGLAFALQFARILDEELASPELPRWPPEALEIDEVRADALVDYFSEAVKLREPATASERAAWLSYEERRDAAAATESPDPQRVPAFKFASNDGWIVSEREAAVIARRLGEFLESEDDVECLLDAMDLGVEDGDAFAELVERWGRFNDVASRLGGYTLS